jgi:hypothetical protein
VGGVLPSGELAAQSGITAAVLVVATSNYREVATLQRLVNCAP